MMNNQRLLKKEINHLINEIIEDCYSYQLYHPARNRERVTHIIDDSVNLLNDLVTRVNHSRNIEDKSEKKQYFRAIKKDLDDKSLSLMQRLNKLG